MKKQKLSKIASAYLRRIEACTSRYEIESIRIGFSQDCSSYKISWEDFMVLYNAQQKKRAEICAYLTHCVPERTPASVCEEVQKKENSEMLLQKIDQLPLRHREAVRLKFQEELTYEEIAEVLGISRAGVGRILSEAIRKLREMLNDGE